MRQKLLMGLFALFLSGVSMADHSAVEQRQAIFEQVEEDTERLEKLFEQQQWDKSVALALTLKNQLQSLQGLFPEESKGEGRSRSKIWDNWQDFSQRLGRLENNYQQINSALLAGNQTQAEQALDDAGSSCRSCHMKYRSLW